jgi:TonB family protein
MIALARFAKNPVRTGITSSAMLHVALALIMTYVLVYEPPINLSQVSPAMLAVPVLLDQPKPKPVEEPPPPPKDSLKKSEEPPPPEPEPPVTNIPVMPDASYLALVRGMLEAHKRYPKRAIERNHEGVVVLWFVLNRYGQVINYKIQQSSGSEILDNEVVRLINKIKQFPLMPDDVAQDSMEITMPIRFKLI